MLVQESGELRLGQRADFLCLDPAALEQDQGRDAADAELRRRLRILVDVELGDPDALAVFLGDLIENAPVRGLGSFSED